jgi:Domain of unknown function (DUF5979)
MRDSVRILVVAAMAFGGVVATVVPGSAGTAPENTVIVEKEVTGDVPAGTTFTVEVTCGDILGPGAALSEPVVITFAADGTPTSDNSLTTPAGTGCLVEETANGGATSTGYACDMVRGPSDDTPPFLGNCDSDNEVSFDDVIGDTATITVTNDFPPAEPVTPAAQAVQAAPGFTG